MIYIKNISNSEQIFRGRVTPVNGYTEIPQTEKAAWYSDETIFNFIATDIAQIAKSNDGANDITNKTEQWNFLGNLLPSSVNVSEPIANNPFADKGGFHFRGTGKTFTCPPGVTTVCEFAILYAHVKLNGCAVMYGQNGDTINLKVLDTATGTHSTIPNYTLDQFGFNWNILSTGMKEILPYVADLYQGMRVVVEYKNNSNNSIDIGVNYYIHEE